MKKWLLSLLVICVLVIVLIQSIEYFNMDFSETKLNSTLQYGRTLNGIVKQKEKNDILKVSILNEIIEIKTNYSTYLNLESGDNVRVRLYYILDENKRQIGIKYEIVR